MGTTVGQRLVLGTGVGGMCLSQALQDVARCLQDRLNPLWDPRNLSDR
jgi:hypothetical protein